MTGAIFGDWIARGAAFVAVAAVAFAGIQSARLAFASAKVDGLTARAERAEAEAAGQYAARLEAAEEIGRLGANIEAKAALADARQYENENLRARQSRDAETRKALTDALRETQPDGCTVGPDIDRELRDRAAALGAAG